MMPGQALSLMGVRAEYLGSRNGVGEAWYGRISVSLAQSHSPTHGRIVRPMGWMLLAASAQGWSKALDIRMVVVQCFTVHVIVQRRARASYETYN